MKLNYREETARMLKALRKAGYDNSQLRREVTLTYCRDSMGNHLLASEESNAIFSGVVSIKLYQQLINQALELGFNEDKLFLQVEEGVDTDSGYVYARVLSQEKLSDTQYFFQVLQLYNESKLQSEQEAMKQDVESLLGCKITAYTLNQLKNTLDKYNNGSDA